VQASSPSIRLRRKLCSLSPPSVLTVHLVGGPPLPPAMPREDREAHQQQKKVGEDHPFVLPMRRQAGETRAKLEAGEDELVDRDDRKTRERHAKELHLFSWGRTGKSRKRRYGRVFALGPTPQKVADCGRVDLGFFFVRGRQRPGFAGMPDEYGVADLDTRRPIDGSVDLDVGDI
jgi:hypothetical protein